MPTTQPRSSRDIASLRLMGWIGVFLVLLVFSNPTAKESVNRPDVADSPTALMERLEADGATCWTAPQGHPASLTDRDPHVVITEVGVVREPAVVRDAMENWYAAADHDLVVYGFCD